MHCLPFARASALVLLSLPLSLPLGAQPLDTPGLGFGIETRPWPAGVLAQSLSSGHIVTFDQQTVQRWDADGELLLTLASFDTCDPFVFPPGDCLYAGLFEVDPSESFVLVGESSFGDIWRVDLAGGGKMLLTNLAFNYDASFESGTSAIVSAAAAGFGSNQLYRLDTVTGATQLLADLQGFSGPVAVDPGGNVFYASQQSHDVLLFLAGVIAAPPTTLTDGDALVFASGFDAASELVAGDEPFTVYLGESDFFSGAARLWRLGATPATSTLLAEAPPFFAIGNLTFRPGFRQAVFAAFQPSFGGTLTYTSKDFVSVAERFEVTPARPTASLSGPGLAGPGQVDFALSGAYPFGPVLLLWGPQGLYDPVETAYFLTPGQPPIFTGMDVLTTQILPVLFFADANGELAFPFTNDGTLTGLLALQGAIFDLFGNLVATSTAALN